MLKRWLLYIALVGLVGCHSASPPQPTKHIAAGEIGSSLPDFSVKDLQGHPLSSVDLRGKVVLIDFWATGASRARKRCPVTRNSSMNMALVGSWSLASSSTRCPTWKTPSSSPRNWRSLSACSGDGMT